ncbi:uncharacterized protein LOC112567714 isoform X2 [Pomacea canaliculata]|uniref:uncharacterized protein LOC112567714 isoform X2 n=1 Tax=Pomacea canaliculata TaxID=400727 RepID=UPI000D72AD9A|nr:uncharacterized protein LOC112567714 isoform X2 [Pomacea canaliculata]
MFTIFMSHCAMWMKLTFITIIIFSPDLVVTSGLSGEPTVSCHTRYVAEGKSLDCDCRLSHFSNSHSSDILLTWPGYSDNSVLKVMNVTRTDNGTVFTCLMIRGEQKKTANYTLQVAYGPDDQHTTIHGPPSFVTDGTKRMSLTCEVTEVHPLPWYTWDGFHCLNDDTERGVCVLKPQPPWDDGREVHCTARSRAGNNNAGKSTYSLNLTYPPLRPPDISGTDDGQVKGGDSIHCTVSGGKPLVTSVNFICLSDPPHEDQPDVRTATTVTSSLTISSDKMMRLNTTECVCAAVWEQDEEMYSYNSSVFVVLDQQSRGVFLDIIIFGASGAGGTLIVLIFIIVISAFRCKHGSKGRNLQTSVPT